MATTQSERPPLGVPDSDLGLRTTKVARPRVPSTYVSRPQVDAMLEAGAHGPLTVVCAGAGWGKTLAAARWAATDPRIGPVAWVSLDESENEPRLFWSYVVTALRGACSVPPSNPLAELVPGLGSEDEFLRRLETGLGELPEPVVLVLDDFQLIVEPTILARLSELLRHGVDRLRLVVLTRADPDLPLHRLRMRGDLAEIRPRDLAFDAAEASALLDAHGVPVDADEARLLVQRTEGWPAGLRLAALFLGREPRPPVTEFAGDDQSVAGYLADEVFESHGPDMQRFLLRTSIVARVSSGLAEELTGQPRSQRMLEDLERSNAFVVGLGPGRQWFRYHALLREMLHHRVLVDSPDLLPDLHRRAARWFGDHGHPIEALEHATHAEDWSLVGHLLVTQAAPLLVSADRAALVRVLARVPGQHLADGPELALCGAGQLFYAARYEDMEVHLQLAAAHLEAGAPDPQGASRATLLLLSTVLARIRGDIDLLVEAATEALEIVSGIGRFLPAAPAYRAIAQGNLGAGLLWSGRSAAAEECLLESVAASEENRVELSFVNALAHLGLALAAQGRLRLAAEHAGRAIELVESRGWAPLPQAAMAYLALATVEFQRNNVTEARSLLAQGRPAARERSARVALELAQVRLDASLGRVAVSREQLSELRRELTEWEPPAFLARWLAISEAEVDLAAGDPAAAAARIEPRDDQEAHFAREQLCLARAFLDQGDPQRADEVLAPLRREDPGVESVAEVWLLTALAADALREDNRAVAALARALELAGPEGISRPFLVLGGDRTTRLLARLVDVDPEAAAIARDLLGPLPSSSGATPVPGALPEPLTDREVMVLRLLPTMQTNAEIASELYVSINTVKAHLKHIFRKLGVDSRRQAVHRARELGLLAETGGADDA